ncbi:thioesterase family protein [Gordonia sp. LSe1-13]|uniref:Thioesterase family protein n=1 Tax=Gordonia sesuvii TaxID=3116777 RepID=A0ABU7MHV3_9ACTN|nr:thioesterase family protein [Gordonia sp. LSe1-13]
MKQLSRYALGEEFSAQVGDDGTWSAEIDPSWWGWSGPHGGVIAALAVHVAGQTAPDATVRALDLRFVGRPDDGELVLTPTVTPVGRSTRVVDVVVGQQGRAIATASITMGRVEPSAATDIVDIGSDVVPRPEDCAPFMIPPEIVPMGGHLDLRPVDGPLPLTGAAEPRMRAWITTLRPMTVDAAYLALLADCLPPALFPTLTAPVAVPTVSLSMHVAAPPENSSPAPILVQTHNISTSGGWSVDDTTLRDERGRLLAAARQSRRVVGWTDR